MPQLGTPTRQFGPFSLAQGVTNIYNQSSPKIYDIITHIHVMNRTSSPATFTMYLGQSLGSAAGTELFPTVTLTGKQGFEWYGNLRMECTDFLTGSSGTSNAITVTGEGKRYISEITTTTTTQSPTTTTLAPTTTTIAPTTIAPTTVPGTTQAPTTTTAAPTTAAPTTAAPTTTTTTCAPAGTFFCIGTDVWENDGFCGQTGPICTNYGGSGSGLGYPNCGGTNPNCA